MTGGDTHLYTTEDVSIIFARFVTIYLRSQKATKSPNIRVFARCGEFETVDFLKQRLWFVEHAIRFCVFRQVEV